MRRRGCAAIEADFFASPVISPPLLLLLFQVRIGKVESVDAAMRRRRTIFYVLGTGGMLLLVAVMKLDAPGILRVAVFAAIATNIVAAAVNHYVTKVSVHAAAMAGCAAVLALNASGSGVVILMGLRYYRVGPASTWENTQWGRCCWGG